MASAETDPLFEPYKRAVDFGDGRCFNEQMQREFSAHCSNCPLPDGSSRDTALEREFLRGMALCVSSLVLANPMDCTMYDVHVPCMLRPFVNHVFARTHTLDMNVRASVLSCGLYAMRSALAGLIADIEAKKVTPPHSLMTPRYISHIMGALTHVFQTNE